MDGAAMLVVAQAVGERDSGTAKERPGVDDRSLAAVDLLREVMQQPQFIGDEHRRHVGRRGGNGIVAPARADDLRLVRIVAAEDRLERVRVFHDVEVGAPGEARDDEREEPRDGAAQLAPFFRRPLPRDPAESLADGVHREDVDDV